MREQVRRANLYHFSEEGSIDRFIPREKQNRPDVPAVVWAIDAEHEFTYFFPRDCPRIVLRRPEQISDKHAQLFFSHTTANSIITVEQDWYARISEQTLYRYALDASTFELFDATAGYYVSHQPVLPLQVDEISNLIERLLQRGIELRFTTSLYPLREAILASDFDGFGIHRFNNAKK
ncbi:hypothetical protein JCM10914_2429 [Paenibacillus sp. JCM 10914]|nr:hypothetical protein JCM10914_2429 [Paenibacillus sp. JCM 10914]